MTDNLHCPNCGHWVHRPRVCEYEVGHPKQPCPCQPEDTRTAALDTYRLGWNDAMDTRTADPGGLRVLSDAATPGPWKVGAPPALDDGIWSESAVTQYADDGPSSLVAWCHADDRAEADAALIVAAVNYVRAALQEGADRG